MREEIMTEYGRVKVLWNPSVNQNADREEKNETKPLRTVAYCRVSTDLEGQAESFELQERYYARLIANTPGWVLAGIYSDKGVTGTAKNRRVGFQRMIRHCEEGKIDRIICKSISRFSRNTMDLLDTVRYLKELGIGVFFEKEGIDTLSIQSEFLLSTVAAIAQEESRSISENMAWSFKKRFQSGIPVFKRILGYDVIGKGADRIIRINEKEAAIVKEIYEKALEGMAYKAIAELMMQKGHETFDGKKEWTIDRIKGILENEKYIGDILCQKTYTASYLNHRTIRNRGERPQYLLKNYHPAIIDQKTFDEVQKIIKSKQRGKPIKNNVYPLSGRVFCGKCGSKYHRFVAHGNGRWSCSTRMKSKSLCDVETIGEKDIEKAMVQALDVRYGLEDKNLIHRMKLDITALQQLDNIEQQRIIIKNELAEALYQEIHSGKEVQREAEEKRIAVEQRLEELERFWFLLEKDREFRRQSLLWIDNLPYGENRMTAFFDELNISHMRAWIVSITVLSPMLFKIRWFDNTETIVDIG